MSKITFVFWTLLALVLPLSAQEKPGELRVATREIAPFVIQKGDRLTGFSIELWDAIADELGIQSKYSVQPSATALVNQVKSGNADIGIAAVSITSKRDKVVDFSQPIYDSGLQIMVRGEGHTPSLLEGLVQVLKSPLLGQFAIAIIVLMLVPAHVVWALERRHDDTIVRHKSYFPGIFEAIWWTVSCLATQSEEMPKTVMARILAVIWMFFAIIFTAYVTAALTANLTLESLRGNIQGPNDLPGKRVATVSGSTSAAYLQDAKIKPQLFPRVEDAIAALESKKVEAVVYDMPILSYYAANEGKNQVTVVGPVFRRESYGIVVPTNSPWRRKINNALLTLRENGTYDQLNEQWFGAGE